MANWGDPYGADYDGVVFPTDQDEGIDWFSIAVIVVLCAFLGFVGWMAAK